jgi:hypothetical protein
MLLCVFAPEASNKHSSTLNEEQQQQAVPAPSTQQQQGISDPHQQQQQQQRLLPPPAAGGSNLVHSASTPCLSHTAAGSGCNALAPAVNGGSSSGVSQPAPAAAAAAAPGGGFVLPPDALKLRREMRLLAGRLAEMSQTCARLQQVRPSQCARERGQGLCV